MHDPINPSHYTSGPIECINAMEASMSPEAFKGFLKGNIQKYVWRYEAKGGAESLQKAQWYLARLITTIEAEQNKSAAIYEAVKDTFAQEIVAYDPDDYMISGCPDGFCPRPDVRQGPSEDFFSTVR